MRARLTQAVKLGLFFCLALTFYKGFMKLPEVYPVVNPTGFFRGIVNDAENSLIMEERRYDINYQTGLAIEMRLEEMAGRGDIPAPGALVDKERAEMALKKAKARDIRNADYVVFARQKLERARRLEAQGWTMGWSVLGSEPGTLGPGAGPCDPDWTIAQPSTSAESSGRTAAGSSGRADASGDASGTAGPQGSGARSVQGGNGQ